MNREQLAHLVRGAAKVTGKTDILVIGSQAILGSFDEDALPPETTLSMEADLGVLDFDPADVASDEIDGSLGEMSPFFDAFGYYAQGISVTTAVLPTGWRDRLVEFTRDDTAPARGWCLEPHDLVIAKLVRGDPKDYDFADALVGIDAVRQPTLTDRLATTKLSDAVRNRIARWIQAGTRG